MEADEGNPVASLEGLGTKIGKARVALSATLLPVVVLSGSDIVVSSTMGDWQTLVLVSSPVGRHLLPLLRDLAFNCSIGVVAWSVEMRTSLSPVVPAIVVIVGTLLG